ncbi:COG2902 NAD-specific glutamate dehydrogenase [Rhabdaerophilaceae bacterium]
MSHDTNRIVDIAAGSAELPDALARLIFTGVDAEDAAAFSEPVRRAIGRNAAIHFDQRTPGVPLLSVSPSELGHGSVVNVINDDMPFLLDSTMAELTERGLTPRLVAHPIFAIERAGSGQLIRMVGLAQGREIAPVLRESYLHIEITDALDAQESQALTEALGMIYRDIRAAVSDWLPMRSRLAEIATRYRAAPPLLPADEIAEAVQFLDWLLAENFTFLGVREYRFATPDISTDPVPGDGLGILRDPDVKVLRRGSQLAIMTPEIRTFLREPTPLFVQKANVKSRIHRRVYLDYIGVKLLNAHGELEGELRVIGLFTSSAYNNAARSVPYLRHKVARVLERAGFDPASHSGKALLNVLETYPRDELFQVDVETLYRFSMDVLALLERPRLRALARVDRFDRFVSVMVYVPKDHYDTSARLRIGDYLARVYEGRVSAAYPAYPEGPLARTHFIIGRTDIPTPKIDRSTLEAGILTLVRTWSDGLRDALAAEESDTGAALFSRYGSAFNAAYREAFSADETIHHLGIVESLNETNPYAFDLSARTGEPETRASLKVFSYSQPITLSRRVPILENLGFTVVNERSYRIRPIGGAKIWLHDMTLERAKGGTIAIDQLAAPLEDALDQIFAGRLEADRFNILITDVGLSPREADILRAYSRYLRQIGVPFGQVYIADALARYPSAARALARAFDVRFNPDLSATDGERGALFSQTKTRLIAEIDTITSLDDDRIFRRMLNLVEATLRTNVYQRVDGAERATLAFKFLCSAVDGLPLPRPLYEIFVSAPDVEGLHLRFGKVARGGLRWSDRPMDFRTEILGLVKAQQVKNSVIVPVGAKGGFVPKLLPPPTDRDAWFAEGTRAYKVFINALLDVTDTILNGTIVPPERTLRYDEDDAYLVVAADKGTATFSDTANAISEARGHWLADAFASGGSAGYDHKKMAITARGGWEAVKRHFREVEIDIQTQPFTVVGVGDMSGDVFGNGMLLSPAIRLLAAFDHRDIFIDPNPDPAVSFGERKRLFEKPRSSWQDYDRSLISAGGGVFSRLDKKISLSSEVQATLGLDHSETTPQQVMIAILKAKVDLLWFGGIGTYIRSSAETDADAGDRANDAIRITGADLNARVIGEGANLGMTQRGRIEAALKGVKLNTDAIDNSAGVNSSDVEVNLKIALAIPEADGRLSREERNGLLADMTDDVALLVLRNNYLQSLALSLAQRQGAALNAEMADLMRALEAEGRLDRSVEFLPSNREVSERTARGQGLTRPELAVLLAYAKLSLYDQLLASDVPDDPYLGAELRRYFPKPVQDRFADAIENHRLRREIVTTQLTNAIINRCGPGIVVRLKGRTGRGVADIVRAYALARDVFAILDINFGIDALDNAISGARQLDLYAAAADHAAERMLWFLRNVDFAPGLSALAERFGSAVASVEPDASALLAPEALALRAQHLEKLVKDAVPAPLARRIVDIPALGAALDGALVSEKTGGKVFDAVRTLFALADEFDIANVKEQATRLNATDAYERLALDRASAASEEALRRIAIDVLGSGNGGDAGVAAWASAHSERLVAVKSTISDLMATPLNQAKLTVLGGLLADLTRD